MKMNEALSQITNDQIEIDGKTIGILPIEKESFSNIDTELAHLNARLVTRKEALEYQNKRAGILGSEAVTEKFGEDSNAESKEPIVLAIHEGWYVLGYLSDVGEDMPEIEYQGIIVVTEE